MTLCFELTMPGVASWNGRWTGEDKYYAVLKNVGRSKAALENARKILKIGSFSHAWDDGWRARITVREVSGSEVAQVRRASQGFCGYEWMISSILLNHKIEYLNK